MEGLIAALLGWIDTEHEIINIQTGLRIENVTDDDGPKALVTSPTGEKWEYADTDAERIFDRAEALAVSAGVLIQQLNQLAAAAPAVVDVEVQQ